jgi:hypothetical protein
VNFKHEFNEISPFDEVWFKGTKPSSTNIYKNQPKLRLKEGKKIETDSYKNRKLHPGKIKLKAEIN